MKADVIVVGLGAVGAATLFQLAKQGVNVVGIDQFSPPHDRGSSHGETRITRQGIGEGDDYVPLSLRAHEIWRELEAETGESLLLACGLIVLGRGDGRTLHHGKPDFVRRSQGAAERFGVPHEMLSPAEALYRYPQFQLTGEEIIYFEPGGGLVYPERCIDAQLSQARRLGARIVSNERVISWSVSADGVRVVTDVGVHDCGHLIAAVGAWAPRLVGGPIGALALQPQTLHWYQPIDRAQYASDRFPTFIWMHGSRPEEAFYGFPIPPLPSADAVKVATEHFEDIPTADSFDRVVSPEMSKSMFLDHVDGRLSGLHPTATRSVRCLYTMAPDADFVVGPAPDNDRVVIASACSGHGFKHSAAVGELLANNLLHADQHPIPEIFGLERLTTARS